MAKKIIAHCDGGLGNRYNTLVVSFAFSEFFRLPVEIIWPIDKWCGAAFSDLFDLSVKVTTTPISEFQGGMPYVERLGDMLFHKHFSVKSLDKLSAEVEAFDGSLACYFPYLPEKIDKTFFFQSANRIRFRPYFYEQSQKFIHEHIPLGFYGIHLRRTDLTMGFLDYEVLELKMKYRDHHIFLCCDNLETEVLLSGGNVITRGNKHHVQKTDEKASWKSKNYYGFLNNVEFASNVNRPQESIIEAVIDLLILSNAKLIGNSMSSFFRAAQLIQDAGGGGFSKSLLDPVEVSIESLIKTVKNHKLTFIALLSLFRYLSNPNNTVAQEVLYKEWIKSGLNDEVWLAHYNLFCLFYKVGRSDDALSHYQELIKLKPDFVECLKLIKS